MFKYNIRGENIEITSAIRDYAEKRIGKLEKYFQDAPDATVYVNARTYQTGEAKAEVTIPLPRLTLRAEETSEELYSSIDLVVDKLDRQVKKYKTRINRHSREKLAELPSAEEEVEAPEEVLEGEDIQIVRSKHVSLKPMTAEEAALQMEMLGHTFFIFEDPDSGQPSLVYKRRKGQYGLIEIGPDAD